MKLTIINADITNILNAIELALCYKCESVDEEDKIYLLPILTYALYFKEQDNNVIFNIAESDVTQFIGDLLSLKSEILKYIAQILCTFCGRSTILELENNQKITYDYDNKFIWEDKKAFEVSKINCNTIKQFNKNFDYSILPEKKEFKHTPQIKFVVDDNLNIIYSDTEDSTKIKGYTKDEIIESLNDIEE